MAGVQEQALLIDIDGESVAFGLVEPGPVPIVQGVKRYRSLDFPTATDCITGFARDNGLELMGRRVAVVVSGAVTGDTIRIARCPWILSRRGIGYLTGTEPLLLNDGAAKMWSDLTANPSTHRPLGSFDSPDVSRPGKYMAINFATGLGAAMLIVDADGSKHHIETEMGHIAFSPIGPVEEKIEAHLYKGRFPVGWERVMQCDASDPAWLDVGIAGQSAEINRHRAAMLGSFVGDAMLATGAWSGVFLHGNSRRLLSSPDTIDAFQKRLEGRSNFQANLRAVPRWTVENPMENLVGAAQYLSHRI